MLCRDRSVPRLSPPGLGAPLIVRHLWQHAQYGKDRVEGEALREGNASPRHNE